MHTLIRIILLFFIFFIYLKTTAEASTSSRQFQLTKINSIVDSNKSELTLISNYERFWDQYDKNLTLKTSWIPPKFNSTGKVATPRKYFSKKDIDSGNFIKIKQKQNNLIARSFRANEAFTEFDELESFFPTNYSITQNINSLNKKSLFVGNIKSQLWSGDFWPLYRGGISSRYNHQNFPIDTKWEGYKNVFNNYFPINFDDPYEVDNLSPSEKYDILVGDTSFTLTQQNLDNIFAIAKEDNNNVEPWFGLCNGWAISSYTFPRPEKVVTININHFMGKSFSLKFYPDDLKAIATQLWTNAFFDSHALGRRCEKTDPPTNDRDRIKSKDCFDINPGVWHIALTNQIGIRSKNLIMDATYDYEVWNQPILSYDYTFFNPNNRTRGRSFRKLMIPIEDYKQDKFKPYRSADTKFVIGVVLNLTFLNVTSATHSEINSVLDDKITTVQYLYDLELDSKFNIIGGEWYQLAHPDFIWYPLIETPESIVDRQITDIWADNNPIPISWNKLAPIASSIGQPIGKIVQKLFQESKK